MVSKKSQFQFSDVNDIGPRSRNDPDLPSLTQLVVCIFHLLSHRLLYFLKKSNVFTFFYRKAYVTKFALGVNKVKVNLGSSFVQTYDGLESPTLHTKFRGIRSTGSGEEDFLKVFTIYGHGGHLGHVTWTIYTIFGSPYLRRLHIKMALIGQEVSEEKMFENGERRRRR